MGTFNLGRFCVKFQIAEGHKIHMSHYLNKQARSRII
jgi:hypothetical protein